MFQSAEKTFIENEKHQQKAAIPSPPNRALYFRNCIGGNYSIGATTAKIFVDSCRECEFTVSNRVITGVMEVWNSNSCKWTIKKNLPTIQIDDCADCTLQFDSNEQCQDIVWTRSTGLAIQVDGSGGSNLTTGRDSILGIKGMEQFSGDTDQVACQCEVDGRWTQKLVYRTPRGYLDIDK